MPFFQQDQTLKQLGNEVLESLWAEFSGLTRTQIALTWIVYDKPVIVNTGGAISYEEFWQYQVRGFSYRGMERIYPASIVKLFYLVAIHEWLEKGMAQSTPELERAIEDMIVDSNNDATSLVVDVLSGTTSGPELSPGPFATWSYQRNIVNRYYQSLGWQELESVNINQKTWCEGPYGRERLFVGELMDNRNMLTTDAVARLFHSIVGGVAVNRERSQQMLKLLKRSSMVPPLPPCEENQITGFIGESIPPKGQIWSKAGWTNKVRHDSAYIEVPGLQPYLLVIFTEGKSSGKTREIIPFISQGILEKMAK